MPLSNALILFATHGIPILFFMYMTIDVLKRNAKKTDYLLVASISFCYLMLFVSEFLRNLVDIKYSSIISSSLFSSLGLLSVCFGLHFILATTKITKSLSPLATALICYLPIIPILFNIISGAQLFSTQTFEQVSMWIYPIYNANYYLTFIMSIITNIIIIIPLYAVLKKTKNDKEREGYQTLFKGMILLIVSCFLLGILPLKGILPPYPYIYTGILFCYLLKTMMNRHQFFEQHDKRYEKLFTMNPFGIALLDENFKVRELNPTAKKFLVNNEIDVEFFISQLNIDEKARLLSDQKIENLEVQIIIRNEKHYFLLSMDQLIVNYEPIRFIMMREITDSKRQQEEIYFLAYHDTLTGIPNRRAFFESLNQELENIQKDEEITIFIIDMNNLKMLNDKIGHEAGDEAIKTLATNLNEIVTQNGMAARIGGDEFIVYQKYKGGQFNPEIYANKISQQFKDATSHFGSIPIGVSIGSSCYPLDSYSLDTLITLADQKMYDMKKTKFVHYR